MINDGLLNVARDALNDAELSSKEIPREVSTHKIEINGLQSKDIKKDL